MDQVIRERAESDHKRTQKHTPKHLQRPFDDSKLPSAAAGTNYLSGWTIDGYPTTKRLLDSGVSLTEVVVGDFAFAKGRAAGNYMFVVGYGANREQIPFGSMWTIMEETSDQWAKLLAASRDYYAPHLDDVRFTLVSDAGKGALSGSHRAVPRAPKFICDEHRGSTAAENFGGAAAKEAYRRYARATTQAAADAAKELMSGPMLEWVEKLDDKYQCAVASRRRVRQVSTSSVRSRPRRDTGTTASSTANTRATRPSPLTTPRCPSASASVPRWR